MLGDVALTVRFYWRDKRRRDIDNGLKMTLDSLTGIVYADDAQVKHLTVSNLRDAVKPRVEIEIEELTATDEKTAKIRGIVEATRSK